MIRLRAETSEVFYRIRKLDPWIGVFDPALEFGSLNTQNQCQKTLQLPPIPEASEVCGRLRNIQLVTCIPSSFAYLNQTREPKGPRVTGCKINLVKGRFGSRARLTRGHSWLAKPRRFVSRPRASAPI